MLYQPDRCLLISVDALWANGFGVVFPELTGEPGFDDVERTLHMPLGELDQWLDSTEYLELVRLRYFARIVPTAWRRELLAELVANGALAIDGSSLRDI